MSRRADHHLQQQNNVVSLRANELLRDIKANTASVNVNTDTLESLQTTANSSLSVVETKLTNIQTINDTKLDAIKNFLDKDHAQFHLNHHPSISKGQDVKAVGEGLQQVLIYGRKPDGTLQPLETIGDRLLVDVLDLGASGKISTSTALSSVQVCGFDEGTNQFKTLQVDGNGSLINVTKNQDITHASVAVTIATNGVDGEITLNDEDNYVRYMVDGNAMLLFVEGSQDNSNFVRLQQIFTNDVAGSFHGSVLVENPPKYVRLKNYDLSSVNIKIQAIFGRK